MNLEYFKQRFWELYDYAKALREEADEDALKGKTVLDDMKQSESEEEKLEALKKFKKIQFFNNLKLSEMEKTLNVIIEMVSIAKVMDFDLGMTDEQENLYEIGRKRFAPMYVLDSGKLVFLNKEMEEAIDAELRTPSDNDMDAVRSILRANRKWQRKNN